MAEQQGIDFEQVHKLFNQYEYFYTPQRMEKLTDISIKLHQDLRRYGIKGDFYDPRLLVVHPPVSSTQGRAVTVLNQPHLTHIQLLPPIKENLPWEDGQLADYDQYDDDTISYIYIHELLHLYSKRTRKIEKSKDEGFIRTGISVTLKKAHLWEWMNEAVVDDLAQEEYRKITGQDKKDIGYIEMRGEYQNMIQALAKSRGIDPQAANEFFRSACIGEGPLLPLARILHPQFESLTDFIVITDTPMKIGISEPGRRKIYSRLWQEIGEGKSGTQLQKNLLEDGKEVIKITGEFLKITETSGGNEDQLVANLVNNFLSFFRKHTYVKNSFPDTEQYARDAIDPNIPIATKMASRQRLLAVITIVRNFLPLIALARRHPSMQTIFEQLIHQDSSNFSRKLEEEYLRLTLG